MVRHPYKKDPKRDPNLGGYPFRFEDLGLLFSSRKPYINLHPASQSPRMRAVGY